MKANLTESQLELLSSIGRAGRATDSERKEVESFVCAAQSWAEFIDELVKECNYVFTMTWVLYGTLT